MPDITMCYGVSASSYYKICPKRETCWRYKAPPSEEWQSYSYFKFDGDKCDDYWEIETKKKGKKNE